MFQKLATSWELAKSSARVLGHDKELLLFPLMSGIAMVLVSASFFVPIAFFGESAVNLDEGSLNLVGTVVLFLFYCAQYFVIIFFNSALIGAALIRLEGGNPTLGDGLRIAIRRIGPILSYTLIAATVGMLLRALRDRAGFVGRIVVSLVGLAWSLATYLVVPVLVTQNLGPIETVKKSASILKKTWGEQVAGNVGIGFVFGMMTFALVLVAAPILGFAISSGNSVLIVATFVVLGLAFLLLSLTSSALSGIYQAALYRFATTGEAGTGFDQGALSSAFTSR